MTDQTTTGQAIAERIPGVLDRPVATLSAIQAAQHIRVVVAFTRTIAEMAEAQIMEAAWIVRRDYPERGGFDRFVAEQLGETMSPDRVWRYAETWGAIRASRPLRELAQRRPGEAISLIAEYRDAGGDTEALDAADRHVQQALSKPKRTRARLFREMARSHLAASAGRNPADVEQIRTLSEERDAALQELERNRKVVATVDAPAGHVRMLHREVLELLGKMTDCVGSFEAFTEHLPVPGERSIALDSAMDAMLGVSDNVAELGERISEAAMGETDHGLTD